MVKDNTLSLSLLIIALKWHWLQLYLRFNEDPQQQEESNKENGDEAVEKNLTFHGKVVSSRDIGEFEGCYQDHREALCCMFYCSIDIYKAYFKHNNFPSFVRQLLTYGF